MADESGTPNEQPGTPGSEGTPPELILGRFKTPEDVVQAYSSLEPKLTQMGQENSELRRQLQELQTKQTVPPVANTDEDINDLFFQEPAKAVEKIISKALDPLISSNFAREKEAYRSNPDFVKHEAEIDAIVSQMPNLKTQPGIVGQLFKMVKGLHFDETEYEKQVREKVQAEIAGKVGGSLESGTPPGLPVTHKTVELTADEKRVARRFNPELEPEEAYKKYAAKKAKIGGGN